MYVRTVCGSISNRDLFVTQLPGCLGSMPNLVARHQLTARQLLRRWWNREVKRSTLVLLLLAFFLHVEQLSSKDSVAIDLESESLVLSNEVAEVSFLSLATLRSEAEVVELIDKAQIGPFSHIFEIDAKLFLHNYRRAALWRSYHTHGTHDT